MIRHVRTTLEGHPRAVPVTLTEATDMRVAVHAAIRRAAAAGVADDVEIDVEFRSVEDDGLVRGTVSLAISARLDCELDKEPEDA